MSEFCLAEMRHGVVLHHASASDKQTDGETPPVAIEQTKNTFSDRDFGNTKHAHAHTGLYLYERTNRLHNTIRVRAVISAATFHQITAQHEGGRRTTPTNSARGNGNVAQVVASSFLDTAR